MEPRQFNNDIKIGGLMARETVNAKREAQICAESGSVVSVGEKKCLGRVWRVIEKTEILISG